MCKRRPVAVGVPVAADTTVVPSANPGAAWAGEEGVGLPTKENTKVTGVAATAGTTTIDTRKSFYKCGQDLKRLLNFTIHSREFSFISIAS